MKDQPTKRLKSRVPKKNSEWNSGSASVKVGFSSVKVGFPP